jgi:hypothetical protein
MAQFARHRLPERAGVALELGCGSGLVAATVAAAGLARCVIATDASDAALARCAETLRANGRAGVCDDATVTRLSWDDGEAVAQLVTSLRAPHLAALPITVVGAEIVYPSTGPSTLRSLFALARAVTSGATQPAAFWMSYVERQPGTTRAMFAAAWDAGFRRWTLWTRVDRWVPSSVGMGEAGAGGADAALAAGDPVVIDWGLAAESEGDEDAHAMEDAVRRHLPGLHDRIARVAAAVADAAAEAAEWAPPFAVADD